MMDLTTLCHRLSLINKITAAADKAGLNALTFQPTLSLFQECVASEVTRFALITHEDLDYPALFTNIRTASPNTVIIVCLGLNVPLTQNALATFKSVTATLAIDNLCTLDELPDCLTTLNKGELYQSTLLGMGAMPEPPYPPLNWYDLTPAEWRILALMVDNKTGPEMAELLKRSVRTIGSQKASISQKLNVTGGPGSLIRFVRTYRLEILKRLNK